MRGLAGRRVLVCGGSSGIGLATARRFGEEGCRVFICGLDAAQVDAALAGLRDAGADVAGLACDVSSEAGVAKWWPQPRLPSAASTSWPTTPASRGAIRS
jgi:NAD(P)-dependent dehydrogenase (short-subunit alcohol dehydrogenase family)